MKYAKNVAKATLCRHNGAFRIAASSVRAMSKEGLVIKLKSNYHPARGRACDVNAWMRANDLVAAHLVGLS